MNKEMFIILVLTIIMLCVSACGKTDNKEQSSVNNTSNISNTQSANLSGTVPDELEYIPDGYENPATQQGTLNKLTYDTWESFSYEQKSNKITKEAWVYLPYGYTDEEEYNVFYLSHGGWSNETTLMGTDDNPKSFKNVIDNAIQDGNIKPLIIVLPTYNNTSENDSSDYSLAIQLTNQFHNELVNDLIPAVESKYSTYAKDTTPQGLKESRDHRGFGGFSMGSVNTWNTFRYCLDYFRYFMPMSGSYTTDGEYMADLVRQQGYSAQDFFIFAASGTDDFAYSAFKAQIMAMANNSGGMFKLAKNESEGNMSFLEREGYKHDAKATDEYTYNGLRFFWNGQTDTQSADNQSSSSKAYNVEQGTSKYRDFVLDNVLHSETEGDIHYNVYIPEMIIVAPQLNDWQDTSARQTIALTEYFLDTYNIDRSRVYAEGYSGGGETMSRVMGMRPDLYTAYLQCSSQWDGNYTEVVKARVPVYFAIGEKDEYYGSEPSRNAYNAIHKLYEQEGLSNSEIDRLLVLDIKPTSYFSSEGISNQHGYGGYLFVRDKNIMGWLFGQIKK